MSKDTRPTHGSPPQDDPSDEQVLAWMSLAADDALDASTLQRLEAELAARPHLLEASSWIDRIDDLANAGARETSLPPLDTAALKASVLDRVRGDSTRDRASRRSTWFQWRWAPALALLAVAGIFSWQQLEQEPAGLGNVAHESRQETAARGAAQDQLEELLPPPPQLDSRDDAPPEPESSPPSALGTLLEGDTEAESFRQEAARGASTREALGGRFAATDLEEAEDVAVSSRRDVDASPPAPARESRQQGKAVAPEGFAQNSVAADAPSASPASLDDEVAGPETALDLTNLTDHAVEVVEDTVARQKAQATASTPSTLPADAPTLSQLRLRLEGAEAGAELHAQLAEILAVVPSPTEGKRGLFSRDLAARARSSSELESEAASPLDSLITTLRAREAEVSDPELRESLKAWLGRE